MNNAAFNKYLEEMLQKGLDEGSIKPDNIDLARKTFTYEWFYALFDLFTSNNKAIQKLIDNRDYKDSDYTLNEWKIPMEQMVIDWDHCIVNGISVNLSNQIVPHQIQLQEEPTHQHIGGGDSSVYVSMTIIGEDNLIRLRRMFQH